VPGRVAGRASTRIEEEPARRGPEAAQADLIALQRQVGNRAVARLLARDAAPAQAVPGAPPAPANPAVAAVEAEAAETVRRCQAALVTMSRSKDPTERDTAELFLGTTPRLHFTTMTLRSDSEAIRAKRLEAPGSMAYFFQGPTQSPWDGTATIPPKTIRFEPNTNGTIDGDTIVVRGRRQSGAWQSEDDLIGTFEHESSHILVASYGEHPDTSGHSDSFDRYKDEFRAYFVQTRGHYSAQPPDERWKSIRKHLVGTDATHGGYEDLRKRYWSDPAFQAQVDAHHAPDGFNVHNSVRLDALFRLLGAADVATRMDEVILAVLALEPSERAEANASGLIQRLANAVGTDEGARIRRALSTPGAGDYPAQIAAVQHEPKVAAFLRAVALNRDDEIKTTHAALSATERARLAFDAAVWVYVDHHVPSPRTRACVYAMVVTGVTTQFDAMANVLEQCFVAYIGSRPNDTAGPPADLLASLRRLGFTARLVLFRSVPDARAQFVDPLPDSIKRPVLAILRGDRDP
jgi:hypothetical protein